VPISDNTATSGGGIYSRCVASTGAVQPPATGANVYNNTPDNIVVDHSSPPC
jgi:predicted outer membrane repeat protein